MLVQVLWNSAIEKGLVEGWLSSHQSMGAGPQRTAVVGVEMSFMKVCCLIAVKSNVSGGFGFWMPCEQIISETFFVSGIAGKWNTEIFKITIIYSGEEIS